MVELSHLTRDDLTLLVPGFIRAFNEGEWQQHWTEEAATVSLTELIDSPNFYGLVAKSDGQPVGAILGRVRTFNTGRTYYIDELFVSPDFRKRGIAKQLYRRAIDELTEQGVGGAFFTTLRDSAAYHFYVSEGALDLTDSAVFYHPF